MKRAPIAPAHTVRPSAPYCACGCGYRTSAAIAKYIMGHRPRRDPVERFWEKVQRGPVDECWPWVSPLDTNGYASFRPDWRGRRIMAHRYAYQLLIAPVPDDLTIDHLCRNRACCNPHHMEVVTRGENTRRGGGSEAAVRVRQAKAEISCPAGHPRTPEHARRSGNNWCCKTCRREKRAAGLWK